MKDLLLWLTDKGHWLIIIGIIIAILGSFYNAFGLDKDHKFFGGLTQGLIFGLVGAIIGPVLGLVILFAELIIITVSYLGHLPLEGLTIASSLRVIVAFTLTGLILGMIFGFLIGLRLNKLQSPHLPLKKDLLFRLAIFEIVLILSLIIQIVSVSLVDSFSLFVFMDIPLLGGCIFGFMFNIRETISEVRIRFRNGSTKLIIFLLIQLFAPITFNFLIPDFFYRFLLPNILEFIFGIIIGSELNQLYRSKRFQGNPSWKAFIVWSFLGELIGIISLLLANLLQFYPLFYLQNFAVISGIVIGIRKGKIAEYLTQPPIKGKLTTKRDQFGVQSEFKYVKINWHRCVRGFLVTFVIFASYTSSAPFTLILTLHSFYILIFSGLLGAIPIGLIVGCIYGIGPTILFWVKNISDDRLGQIGVFLTILGVVLLAIPSLIY